MTRRRSQTPSVRTERSSSRGSEQNDVLSIVDISDSDSEGPRGSPDALARAESFVLSMRDNPDGLPNRGQVHFVDEPEILEEQAGSSRAHTYGPLGLPPDSGRNPSRRGILRISSDWVGYPSGESLPTLGAQSGSPESEHAPSTSGSSPLGSPHLEHLHSTRPGTPVPPVLSGLPLPLESFPASPGSLPSGFTPYVPFTPTSPIPIAHLPHPLPSAFVSSTPYVPSTSLPGHSLPGYWAKPPSVVSGHSATTASGSFPFRSLLLQQPTPHHTPFDGHTMLDSDPSWDSLADHLVYYDEAKIHNCDKNLDNLLVFTGLFSAVVAAFTIESYKQLQEDPQGITNALLSKISLQLSRPNLEPTNQSRPLTEFQASKSDVLLNILWFLSLVLSLVIASLAIFVKQWLREYLNWECSSATERLRLRHIRYQGLLRWRVFEIAAFLPFLLQLSLILFLIGLSDFLRQLHPTVGWYITGFVVLWMAIFAATLIASTIFVDCPYKVSLFVHPTQRLHKAFAHLRLRLGFDWRSCLSNRYYTYPGDEKGVRRDGTLDLDALVSADKVLADDHILEKCTCNCAKSLGLEDAAQFCRRVLGRYLDTKIESLATRKLDLGSVPSRALNALMGLICSIMPPNEEQYSLLTQEPSPLLELVMFLYRLCNHAVERNRTAYLSNWKIAKSAIHQIPITLLRSNSDKIIEYLLMIMASAPYMLITAPVVIPVRQINTLVRLANGLLTRDNLVDPLSLSRAVLEYIVEVDSMDLDECRENLENFCGTVVQVLQEKEPMIRSVVTTKDAKITIPLDDHDSDTCTEAKRALEAIAKLNTAVEGLIPTSMAVALSRISAPGQIWTPDDSSRSSTDAASHTFFSDEQHRGFASLNSRNPMSSHLNRNDAYEN